MIPTPPAMSDRRSASQVMSTAEVLPATLLNVPSANPTGPVPDKPVVAVDTKSKWKDLQFWISLLTGLTGLVSSVQEILPATGGIDWRVFPFKLLLLVIGAVNAFLRTQINTVTK